MGDIFDTVVQFFQDEAWTVTTDKTRLALHMVYRGENARFLCYAHALEDRGQFVFYSVMTANVPEEKRSAVSAFLTLANYGLIVGNFEMDFTDGEVRYKTSIDVWGDRLTPALVKQVVYANVTTMDLYTPGLMAVIYGDTSPMEAIAEIEGQNSTQVAGLFSSPL